MDTAHPQSDPIKYDDHGEFVFAMPHCVVKGFRGPTLLFAILPPIKFDFEYDPEKIPEPSQFKRAVYRFEQMINEYAHYNLVEVQEV